MGLKPFQKGAQIQPRQAQTRIKPFVPVKRAPIPRPDIKQSQNYLNAQANAQKAQQEATQASSFRGMAKNFLKAVPKATADVLVGTPAKFIASTAEIPETIFKGGQTSQREYKVPGLTPFKSYQSDFQNVAGDVIEGRKGLGSAALELAKVPLAGLETFGIGKGIGKGIKAFKGAPTLSQGIRKAAPEVIDAFVPTTRGVGNRQVASQANNKLSSRIDASIEKVKRAKQQFQQEKNAMREGLSFFDSEKDAQYDAFKKLYSRFGRGKNKEAFESMDVDAIKNALKGKVDPNLIDNVLYSQEKRGDEVLDDFLSMMSKEQKYKDFRFVAPEIKFKGGKGIKPRGLVETISKSPEYSADMAENLKGVGGYAVRKQEPLVREAQKIIAKNLSEAENIATSEISDRATIMSDEVLKHYDSIAQNAKQTGDMQTFELAMNKAKNLALQTDINLRESGRAISAANRFNKQSPEGMLRTLQEIAEQKGAQLNLSNEKVFDFQRKAEEISQILDPRERAHKTFELMDEVYDSVPSGAKEKLYEVLNIPRALMATADLSAPLRQGLFVAARNPKTFAKNFGNMFKYAFSPKAYRNAQVDIVTSPNYNLYVKHKLPLTEISSGLSTREEAFMSQLAEKIPLFGRLSKGSNRAYTGFLNKMRTDLFDDFVKTAELNGIKDPKFFDDAARFVGAGTGRGDIHKLFGGNQSGSFLSNFFFSPRLIASRVSLLNPVYYAKLHPIVRKEALKSLMAFAGTGMSVLGLAKLAGAEVGDDPRSADFGKIKIGKTRYDILGGFQQYARLFGQLATGEKVSTITGKETQLGKGFGSPTRESIAIDFLKSKLAPIPSYLSRAGRGEEYGEPFRPGAEALDRLSPLVIQEVYELMREKGPVGALMAAPSFFGVGSQTYGDQIPTVESQPGKEPTLQWRSEPTMGEDILNFVTGKEVSNVPEEYYQPLLEERQREQQRQIEVDKAKALALSTGQPQQVGDTYVYLQNGVIKTKTKRAERTPLKEEVIRKTTNPFYTK